MHIILCYNYQDGGVYNLLSPDNVSFDLLAKQIVNIIFVPSLHNFVRTIGIVLSVKIK